MCMVLSCLNNTQHWHCYLTHNTDNDMVARHTTLKMTSLPDTQHWHWHHYLTHNTDTDSTPWHTTLTLTSLHDSWHTTLAMTSQVDTPLKFVCDCLHGRVIKNGHTCNPFTLCSVPALVHMYRCGCTYWVTLRVFSWGTQQQLLDTQHWHWHDYLTCKFLLTDDLNKVIQGWSDRWQSSSLLFQATHCSPLLLVLCKHLTHNAVYFLHTNTLYVGTLGMRSTWTINYIYYTS